MEFEVDTSVSGTAGGIRSRYFCFRNSRRNSKKLLLEQKLMNCYFGSLISGWKFCQSYMVVIQLGPLCVQ